jgi:hypothetical protein
MRLLAWIYPHSAREAELLGGYPGVPHGVDEARRPADEGLEWCLIGAAGDDSEANRHGASPFAAVEPRYGCTSGRGCSTRA